MKSFPLDRGEYILTVVIRLDELMCAKKKGIHHLKVLWALTETNIEKICKNVSHPLTRKSSPVDSGQAVPTSILILREERNLAKLVIHNVVSPIILEKWFHFTIRIFPKGKMHNSRELMILKLKPFLQRLEIIEHVSLQKGTDSIVCGEASDLHS